MGGFNIGGFTSGLQGGLGAGMAIRRGRQDEKLRELISEQIGDEGIGRQGAMESLGMDTSDFGLEDPYLFRIMDKIRNRGATEVDPEFDPGATKVAPEDDEAVTPGVMQRANGGAIGRYQSGGSVFARGPQMAGNPNPRMAAPMGGGGGGPDLRGILQQYLQRQQGGGAGGDAKFRNVMGAALQRFQKMPPQQQQGLMQQLGGQLGGMQQPPQQPMPQRPMPQQPMGGGAPPTPMSGNFALPGQPMQPLQPVRPMPFEGGGGGMNPKMGGAPKMGGGATLQPQPPPVQQGAGFQPGARAALPRNPGVQQFAGGGMIPFAPQRYATGGMIPFAPRPYREGGEVSEEEEIRRRAEQNRARKPGRVEGSTAEAKGADRTAKPEPKTSTPKAPKEPGPRSALGRAADKLQKVPDGSKTGNFGRALGRAGAYTLIAGAGAGGIRGAKDAETDAGISESHYLQPGEEASFGNAVTDPEFWSEVGQRAWGGAKGAIKGLFNPIDALTGTGTFGTAQPGAAPAAPEAVRAPPPDATGTAGVGAPGVDRAPAAPDSRLIPKGPTGPQQPGAADVDFSGANPAEVPNFTTQDWVKHREMALRQMVSKGVPITEAMEKIDQQVTGMQQRNFVNYATQGLALMQAGDLNGAQSALRAAFQYFPSGSDVKFGTQNGQMFGIGVNEKTGQPEGKPFPITPESINAVVTNFQKPGAWNEWAQDQRDFQQLMREYEEVKRPLAEAQGSSMLTTAEAARDNAYARGVEAVNAGGAGGATDRRTANKYFTDEYMNIEGLDVSPELARGLASASMQIWDMNRGSVPPATIVETVSRAARIGDPNLRRQFFARMGVTDPTENIGAE